MQSILWILNHWIAFFLEVVKLFPGTFINCNQLFNFWKINAVFFDCQSSAVQYSDIIVPYAW